MSPDELQRCRELRRRIARLRRRLDRRVQDAAAPALAARAVARRVGIPGGWILAVAGVVGWCTLSAGRRTWWRAVVRRLLRPDSSSAGEDDR